MEQQEEDPEKCRVIRNPCRKALEVAALNSGAKSCISSAAELYMALEVSPRETEPSGNKPNIIGMVHNWPGLLDVDETIVVIKDWM